MSATEMPLFPLGTVLYPGGPLRLRIFETRYIDMVRQCLKSEQPFGVIAIRKGSETGEATVHSVGTEAEIIDWSQDSDGLLGLAVRGGRRFRVLDVVRQKDGLYVGRVETLPPEQPVAFAPQQHWAQSLMREIIEGTKGREAALAPDLDDACWVSWRLAELLPLELADKQALLELDDTEERMASIEPHIADLQEQRA